MNEGTWLHKKTGKKKFHKVLLYLGKNCRFLGKGDSWYKNFLI